MVKWITDVIFIAVAAFVGSVICIGVERQQLARMVVVVAVMMALLVTMQDLSLVAKKWNDKINSIQKTVDKIF